MLLKKYFFYWLITAIFFAMSLTACGNKGDLYLPDKDSATSNQLSQSVITP